MKTVPWPQRLVAALRAEGRVRNRTNIVVEKVALGQVCVRLPRTNPKTPHDHCCHFQRASQRRPETLQQSNYPSHVRGSATGWSLYGRAVGQTGGIQSGLQRSEFVQRLIVNELRSDRGFSENIAFHRQYCGTKKR